MHIGKLRHYVEIQRYVETSNEIGEPTKEYEHYVFAWAEIRPLLGRENFAEKQVSTEQTHKIKMRYIPAIESTMRILFEGRVFELIGNPVNYMERSIFLTFNVAETFDHDDVHPIPDPTPLDCSNSVGGIDGTEFKMDGIWYNTCTMFKA